MAQHGKKYNAAASSFDNATQHGLTEAVTKVKTLASAKFDETVELSVRLGVDPRKADQMVRGTVALPSGTGTDVRIAVFAAGDAAQAARDAGAEFVGADDLLAQRRRQLVRLVGHVVQEGVPHALAEAKHILELGI